jgi:hypothetical protein
LVVPLHETSFSAFWLGDTTDGYRPDSHNVRKSANNKSRVVDVALVISARS